MDNVDELCALIQKNIGESQGGAAEEIQPGTPLLMSGLLDSLTIMQIVAQVEERMGISFPETSIVAANFRTPKALWAAIEASMGARAQESTV